ncbi:MAG: hypothetical protein RBT45_00440 [Acholeplasmataceae bacterium]|jgi:hypothetical protein|nr:hypothetical protein [Acholeplasmataceae bacterium]
MKLNPKIYNQLTNEPFEVQEVNGKRVEFHYMDDTPYLFQYASRGRFAIWTSNGTDFKVLIESKYHEALRDFYTEEVNAIWLGFLTKVSLLSRKMNLMFLIPTVIIYIAAGFFATLYMQDSIWTVLILLIVVVVFSNIIQSRLINKRVRLENNLAQDQIRQSMGNEKFNNLVDAQEQHYKEYFKFDDEIEQTDNEQANENEESIKDESEKNNDGN